MMLLDYLHKPILKERFSNAVHKAVSNFKMKNNESLMKMILFL